MAMRRTPTIGRAGQLCSPPAAQRPAFAAQPKQGPRPRDVHTAAQAPEADRASHNAAQAQYFSQAADRLRDSITPAVEQRLATVAASAPGLGPSSRVLDVGGGEGALIPHLQARGVQDILAVDVCPQMLDALKARLGEAGPLGNDLGVRCWLGDVVDLPAYQGPCDAAFFNAVLGNLHDPREALLRTCFLLRPGSHVVISHPLGRAWHERFREANPALVPHALPTREALEALTADLPLSLLSFRDDPDLYLALLQVPEGWAHPAAPLYLEGDVTTGFGRGSKQLGVPTANLPPAPLAQALGGLPTGVYFGWARLEAGPGAPEADCRVHKMVMNIGRRPTFEDADPELTVEVHILHPYASDFYGARLRVVALGYLRPEVRFSGLPELLARINADIGLARGALDLPRWQEYSADPFLLGPQ